MPLATRVSAALDKSFTAECTRHGKALKQKALDAGWPAGAAATIKVKADNGGFVASAGRTADSWEYGSSGRPPLSVVRVFNQRQAQDASQAFEAALGALLEGLV
jgi:hypothetical protein